MKTDNINANKIATWYATRNRFGSNKITEREERLLLLADNHYFGILGGNKQVTVAQVRKFVTWAADHGSAVEKKAVAQ